MRQEIHFFLQARPDLLTFVRENPSWYRHLSRHPEKINEIEQEAKIFFGKTIPQKIDRIHQQLQLANLLMNMMFASNNNEQQ